MPPATRGGWHRSQRRHAAATYRVRVANLPLSYAQHAPERSAQLHQFVVGRYGIDTFHVHTWASHAQAHVWALLAVANEAESVFLRQRLPGTRLNGARRFIEWANDSLPGLMVVRRRYYI